MYSLTETEENASFDSRCCTSTHPPQIIQDKRLCANSPGICSQFHPFAPQTQQHLPPSQNSRRLLRRPKTQSKKTLKSSPNFVIVLIADQFAQLLSQTRPLRLPQTQRQISSSAPHATQTDPSPRISVMVTLLRNFCTLQRSPLKGVRIHVSGHR